jgi:hypothetical protein
MTATYAPIERWSIPRGVVPATLRGVLRAAREQHEGGALWLGRRAATTEISTVVLLEGRGVTEEIGYWEVSARVYGRVGTWADDNDQALLAVAHSHLGRGATAMSGLDRRGAVRVPDLLTIVIPAFGAITDLRKWGIHRFNGQQFVELSELQKAAYLITSAEPVTVLRASEDGVLVAT